MLYVNIYFFVSGILFVMCVDCKKGVLLRLLKFPSNLSPPSKSLLTGLLRWVACAAHVFTVQSYGVKLREAWNRKNKEKAPLLVFAATTPLFSSQSGHKFTSYAGYSLGI